MDYEAVGNSCIIWGTFYVSVGAILVSGGWFLLATYKQANEWLKKRRWLKTSVRRLIVVVAVVIILIGAGSWMVGKGGTKTTKGWNQLNNHETKEALIAAVALEWVRNEMYMYVRPLSFDPNDETIGQKHYGFPEFKTAAINQVLTSNLFDPSNPQDYKLWASIVDYERSARHCNVMFLKLDEKLVWGPVSAEARKGVYDSVNRDFSIYADFKALHKNLHDFLIAEHGQVLTNAEKLWAKLIASRKERGFSLTDGTPPQLQPTETSGRKK